MKVISAILIVFIGVIAMARGQDASAMVAMMVNIPQVAELKIAGNFQYDCFRTLMEMALFHLRRCIPFIMECPEESYQGRLQKCNSVSWIATEMDN